MATPNWKLVSFDLDGTLITGTSSAAHLASKMGDTATVQAYEARYSRGEITNVQFGAFDAARYKGCRKSEIVSLLEDVPLINHISETVGYLNSIGIQCVIATMAWDFVGEYIAKKHGFSAWSGPTLELDGNDVFTGKVATYFHETDKVGFIKNICRQGNALMSEVAHIGDSRSDFPLFQAVGLSVALNGCEKACQIAATSVRSTSLLDVKHVIGCQL